MMIFRQIHLPKSQSFLPPKKANTRRGLGEWAGAAKVNFRKIILRMEMKVVVATKHLAPGPDWSLYFCYIFFGTGDWDDRRNDWDERDGT